MLAKRRARPVEGMPEAARLFQEVLAAGPRARLPASVVAALERLDASRRGAWGASGPGGGLQPPI